MEGDEEGMDRGCRLQRGLRDLDDGGFGDADERKGWSGAEGMVRRGGRGEWGVKVNEGRGYRQGIGNEG
jgi:hypothetical protein